ncbi:hypothetical protein TNCV_1278001 [Trichonephila clavipes]|nr:hypothetical protein TNCV_1278001 [Trichonephila clavipes]
MGSLPRVAVMGVEKYPLFEKVICEQHGGCKKGICNSLLQILKEQVQSHFFLVTGRAGSEWMQGTIIENPPTLCMKS